MFKDILQTKKSGFTLVELLVVIGIIGVLVGAVSLNFNASKVKARNEAFQNSLEELRLAMNLYKAKYGRYPEANSNCSTYSYSGNITKIHKTDASGCAGFEIISGLVPDFVDGLPSAKSSANENCVITYQVHGDNIGTWGDNIIDGDWYKLTAENCHGGASSPAEGIQPGDRFARCPDSCSDCNGVTYATIKVDKSFYESYSIYSSSTGMCR